jgi:hypothetical protein
MLGHESSRVGRRFSRKARPDFKSSRREDPGVRMIEVLYHAGSLASGNSGDNEDSTSLIIGW